MLPLPTPSAVAAFVGLLLGLMAGIVGRSAETVALASAGLVGLAWTLAATVPLARRPPC